MRTSLSTFVVCALSLSAVLLVSGGERSAHADDFPAPDFFLLDVMCPAGKVLQGFQAGEPVCVERYKPTIRVVGGTLVNAFHSIYAADCAANEMVIGGRCQCHASGTWLAGIVNNGYQCACTAHTQHTGAVAVCMKLD